MQKVMACMIENNPEGFDANTFFYEKFLETGSESPGQKLRNLIDDALKEDPALYERLIAFSVSNVKEVEIQLEVREALKITTESTLH